MSLRDLLSAPPSPGSGLDGEVLQDRPGLRLLRFQPDRAERAAVVLVPPLAVPARVYDLRPGHSLVRHLLARGHPVHLLDYGPVGFAQRDLGMEDWVDDIVPSAVTIATEHDGPVHLAGWSLGGTISLLTAAAHPPLRLRSLTAIATPVDYHRMLAYRPLVAASRLTGGRVVGTLARVLGGAPAPLVQGGYRVLGLNREVQRPLRWLRHRDDPDRLAHERAVDGFLQSMPGYPGRFFVQLWHRIILGGQLARGRVVVAGRTVDLGTIDEPVLAIGSRSDEIAAWPAVTAIRDVLPSAPQVRVEEVGGRHLGVLTGRRAPDTTWPIIDDFLADVEQ